MSHSRVFEFQIDGRVSAQRLLRAFEGWTSAVHQIGKDLGLRLGAQNEVSNLSSGSALAAFEIQFPDPRMAEDFSESFDYVIRAAKFQEPINDRTKQYSRAVKKFRSAAKPDIEGAVPGMVWRNPSGDFIINPELDTPTSGSTQEVDAYTETESFGTVEGIMQSLSARNGIRAVVYDTLFDRAVAFYIPESMRENVREKWDKPVEVVGLIRRDPVTGRPTSILEIASIEMIDTPEEDAWREAIGILSDVEPDVLPEVLIRRIRND